jgi:ComEC/Rec2-related protein
MRRRPLLSVTVAFIISTIICLWGNISILAIISLPCVIVSVILFKRKLRIESALMFFSVIVSWFGYLYVNRVAETDIEAYKTIAENSFSSSLTITDSPVYLFNKKNGSQNHRKNYKPYIAEINKIKANGNQTDSGKKLCGKRIRFYYPAAENIYPGTEIEANFTGQIFAKPAYKNAFSQRKYLLQRGVCASVKIDGDINVLKPTFNIRSKLHLIRRLMINKTIEYFPEKQAAFICAVLFGFRDLLSAEMKASFRKTGTGHILAISGLHVGLITAVFFLLARRLSLTKRGAAIVAMLACVFYLGISGGKPSAARAAIMAIIYLGGFIFYRKSNLINALSAAAFIILLKNPYTLTDAGFLLSFTAVIFLSRLAHEYSLAFANDKENFKNIHLAGGSIIYRIKSSLPKIKRRMLQLFALSAAAWIGLWPLSAYYFNMLAFSGIFLNMIIIPFLPVVLTAGITSHILLFAANATFGSSFISSSLIYLGHMPAWVLIMATDKISQYIPLVLYVNRPSVPAMVIYYISFILFFVRRHIKLSTKISALIIAVSAILLCFSMRSGKSLNEEITILPSWQGECAIMNVEGKNVVIGNMVRSGLDLTSFLCTEGVPKIDYVFEVQTWRQEDTFPYKLKEHFPDFDYTFIKYKSDDIINNIISKKEITETYIINNNKDEKSNSLKIIPLRNTKGKLQALHIKLKKLNIYLANGWAGSLLKIFSNYHNFGKGKTVVFLNLADYKVTHKTLRLFDFLEKQDSNKNIFKTFLKTKNGIKIPEHFINRIKYGAVKIKQSQTERLSITVFDGNKWKEVLAHKSGM